MQSGIEIEMPIPKRLAIDVLKVMAKRTPQKYLVLLLARSKNGSSWSPLEHAENEIYTYFDDTLASKSVASRSQASRVSSKISLNILENPKGRPLWVKKCFVSDCYGIQNFKSSRK